MNQTAVCGLCECVSEIVSVIFEEMSQKNIGLCFHCDKATKSEIEPKDDFHFSENLDARY